ncbi:MAG TPA: SRPBCC domain-containing protein [Thermoleophilaceae bacterium]|nr:SRPBCC domain-containing protein [Thermoleophilaceae bacterium]
MREHVTTEQDLVKEIRIEARPETVFPFFTEPEKLTRWLCVEATVDPRAGGICKQIHRDHDGTLYHLSGQFLEVTPPHRVVFTWGWEKPETGTPPGSTVVDVTLEPDGEGTLVTLVHRGLPDTERDGYDGGWQGLLEKLAELAPRS